MHPFQFHEGRSREHRKPILPWSVELDRTLPLTFGLQSLVLFENLANGAGGAGMRDYANPLQTFSYFGTTTAAVQSPFGGFGIMTGANSGHNPMWNTPLAATSTWSFSSLINFGASGANLSQMTSNHIVGNHDASVVIQASTSNGKFSDTNNLVFIGPDIRTLTNFTRLTFTCDGTTTRTYVNGTSNDSGALTNISLGFATCAASWTSPMFDLFWWNRKLSDAEVFAHALDPYGTTLRSAMPVRPRVRPQPPFQPTYQLGPMLAS